MAALGDAGWPARIDDVGGGITSTAAPVEGGLADWAKRVSSVPCGVGAVCRGGVNEEPPRATEEGGDGTSASPRRGEGEDARGGKGEEDPPRGTTSPAPEPTTASTPACAPTRADETCQLLT
jgi:hypothetical protein